MGELGDIYNKAVEDFRKRIAELEAESAEQLNNLDHAMGLYEKAEQRAEKAEADLKIAHMDIDQAEGDKEAAESECRMNELGIPGPPEPG